MTGPVGLAFLGSCTLAVALAALALGRDDLPAATYLVHTSEDQSLPAGGVATTDDGTQLQLSFERVEDLVGAVSGRDPAGVVLDSGTYAALPLDVLRDWRFDGRIVVAYDVDAAQIATQLEVEPAAPGSIVANSFVLLGGTNDIAGDPASIDRNRSFVGAAYRPPTSDPDPQLGRLGWFQDDEGGLRTWLAERALEAAGAYGRPLD